MAEALAGGDFCCACACGTINPTRKILSARITMSLIKDSDDVIAVCGPTPCHLFAAALCSTLESVQEPAGPRLSRPSSAVHGQADNADWDLVDRVARRAARTLARCCSRGWRRVPCRVRRTSRLAAA